MTGTTLIAGDSILSGLVEKKMGRNVKVRCFPGATIHDMYSYLKPLLPKKPSNVILHVSTNDTKDKDSEEIADQLLLLKKHVEDSSTNTKVIISYPTVRNDNRQAKKTINSLRKALDLLNINCITNENITEEQLGKSGLHLSASGSLNLATNYISFIRHL